MGRLSTLVGGGLLFFATLPSSTHYNLNSYSVGPVGTSNSHSSTYYTQTTGGEITGSGVKSTHYNDSNGNVAAEQLAVPQVPTVSNGGGTYSTQLQVTLNDNAGSNNYPSDVTFSIAVATSNCFTATCVGNGTDKFVQTGGTLNSSQFYQSYSAWGSSSGVTVTGLTTSTTYYVAVAAKQGTFTNTEYGASQSSTTAAGGSTVTFSVSPNSYTFSNMLPGTIYTSSSFSFTFATNATYGGTIYTAGQYGGLHSSSKSNTIPATTGSLSSASHGFGLQDTSVGQTSGGPLTESSPYNVTGNNVGTESSTFAPIFTTSSSIVGGSATMVMLAKPQLSDPVSSDYAETMTFIAAGSF